MPWFLKTLFKRLIYPKSCAPYQLRKCSKQMLFVREKFTLTKVVEQFNQLRTNQRFIFELQIHWSLVNMHPHLPHLFACLHVICWSCLNFLQVWYHIGFLCAIPARHIGDALYGVPVVKITPAKLVESHIICGWNAQYCVIGFQFSVSCLKFDL